MYVQLVAMIVFHYIAFHYIVIYCQLYRLEDYEGSMQLYKDVVKNSEDDYDDERQTNVSAVTAALCLNNSNSAADMVCRYKLQFYMYESPCF